MNEVRLEVVTLPVPTIVVRPARPTKDNAIYAGSLVDLSCADQNTTDSNQYFWIVSTTPPPLDSGIIGKGAASTVTNLTGLDGWIKMRQAPEKQMQVWKESISADIRANAAAYLRGAYGEIGGADQGLILQQEDLGAGPAKRWTPDREGIATIYAFALSGSNYWGVSSRTLR